MHIPGLNTLRCTENLFPNGPDPTSIIFSHCVFKLKIKHQKHAKPLPVNSLTWNIVFSQISRGFDDVLPFFADEYAVYDFQTIGQIAESRKDVFRGEGY